MWSDEWLLRLHIDKCKSVSYCIKHPVNTDYHILNRDQLFPLEKVQSMADLGVCFDSNLTFGDHISEKINKAYNVLNIIEHVGITNFCSVLTGCFIYTVYTPTMTPTFLPQYLTVISLYLSGLLVSRSNYLL